MAVPITEQNNPYIVGRPIVEPERFFGREDIFQFINDSLDSGLRVILLYGQRRIGKSSVLSQIRHHVKQDHVHFVQFDLQGQAATSLPEVLFELAEAIVESLDERPEYFSLPEDPAQFAEDVDWFHNNFLPAVYEFIEGKRLLLLLDEFDVLADYEENIAAGMFFPYIQNILHREKRLIIIPVVGRRLEDLPALTSLFREALYRKISLLRPAEAESLIVNPAKDILQFDEGALKSILELTAGHPYLTQLLGFEIFHYLRGQGRTTVTAEDVREVTDKAIESGTGGLAWFRDGLPIAERVILSAVAEVTEEALYVTERSVRDVLENHGIKYSGTNLIAAMTNLVDWDILEDVEGGGYSVTIELVRRWVAQEHPLSRVMDDLEHIDARAARIYEKARAASQENDLITAVELYRDALSINPNHYSAQLELAQRLYEQENYPDAVIEYERAYQFNPLRTQGDLVKARLSYGRDLLLQKRHRNARIQIHKALEIDPEDKVARERLSNIIQEWGIYRRQIYKKVVAVSAPLILILMASYTFLFYSYYIGTKTNPYTASSFVVRSGYPGFGFLPRLGEIRVETDFTIDQLATDHKSEHLEALEQGKYKGIFVRKLNSYQRWIRDIIFHLSALEKGRAYVRLGDMNRGIKFLVEALTDVRWQSRQHAARFLGQIAQYHESIPNEVLQALIGALGDLDLDVRRSAASALGEIARQQEHIDLIPPLLESLNDPNPLLRRGAVLVLGRIGQQQDVPREVFRALVEALQNDRELAVRGAAADVLGQIGQQQAVTNEVILNLLMLLKDPDFRVRQAGASALGAIAKQDRVPQKVIVALLGALNDDTSSDRLAKTAATALGQIAQKQDVPQEVIPVLVKVLKAPKTAGFGFGDREDVPQALAQIAQRQPTNVISAVLGSLKDSNSNVREGAVFALGRIGQQQDVPREVFRALVEALQNDRELAVRRAAAEALGRIGQQQDVPQDVIPALLVVLTDGKVRAFRDLAGRALGQIGQQQPMMVIQTLLETLHHEKPGSRQAAASILGQFGEVQGAHPVVTVALLETLRDSDPGVRQAGVQALGQIGKVHGAAQEVILALLETLRDSSSDVRRAAASILGEIGEVHGAPQEVILALLESLRDSNSGVRRAVVSALGEIEEVHGAAQEVILALLESLSDSNSGVRRAVVRALGEIGQRIALPKNVIRALQEALKDSILRVRDAAVTALAQVFVGQASNPAQLDSIGYLIAELKKANADRNFRAVVRQAIIQYFTIHVDQRVEVERRLIEFREESPEPQLRIAAALILEEIRTSRNENRTSELLR